MMIDGSWITIEVKGGEKLEARFVSWQPPQVHERLKRAMDRILAKVTADAVEDAPRDTGVGAESLAFDSWETDDGVWGKVFSPLPYMLVMEYGRRPASEIGLHPPPEGALDGWAARHGMDEEAADAMRWSIAIKGIEPRPFLRPALAASKMYALRMIAEELMREET